MTVGDLIDELQRFPKEAHLVFDFTDALDYDFVSVTYGHGEVIIHVEGDDSAMDDHPSDRINDDD